MLGRIHQCEHLVADRITRASEKTARQAGVNLAVFTGEQEAIARLLSPASRDEV